LCWGGNGELEASTLQTYRGESLTGKLWNGRFNNCKQKKNWGEGPGKNARGGRGGKPLVKGKVRQKKKLKGNCEKGNAERVGTEKSSCEGE